MSVQLIMGRAKESLLTEDLLHFGSKEVMVFIMVRNETRVDIIS